MDRSSTKAPLGIPAGRGFAITPLKRNHRSPRPHPPPPPPRRRPHALPPMKSRLLALTLTILLVGCGPLYTDSQEGPAHRGLYSALVHNNSWYAYEVRFYCDGHSQPFDRIFLRGKGETVRETIRAKVPCSRGIVVAVRLEGRRMFPLSDGQPLNVYPGDQIVITLQDHAPLSSVVVVPGRQG